MVVEKNIGNRVPTITWPSIWTGSSVGCHQRYFWKRHISIHFSSIHHKLLQRVEIRYEIRWRQVRERSPSRPVKFTSAKDYQSQHGQHTWTQGLSATPQLEMKKTTAPILNLPLVPRGAVTHQKERSACRPSHCPRLSLKKALKHGLSCWLFPTSKKFKGSPM